MLTDATTFAVCEVESKSCGYIITADHDEHIHVSRAAPPILSSFRSRGNVWLIAARPVLSFRACYGAAYPDNPHCAFYCDYGWLTCGPPHHSNGL
jgi:hypothetical protein